jgi:hypothetical protein
MTRLTNNNAQLSGSALVDVLQLVKDVPKKKPAMGSAIRQAAAPGSRSLTLKERMQLQQNKMDCAQ